MRYPGLLATVNVPLPGQSIGCSGRAEETFAYAPVSTGDGDETRAADGQGEEETSLSIWIAEAMAQVSALQQYAVITVVLSGFAFSGLVTLELDMLTEELNVTWRIGTFDINLKSLVLFGLTISVATCIAAGLYATLIFTLCSIYGANAVARGDKDAFDAFMKNTVNQRKFAFGGFKLALVAMSASIGFIILAKLPLIHAIIGIALGAIFFCFSFWQASLVIDSAGKFIFGAGQPASQDAVSDEMNSEDGVDSQVSTFEE